MRRATPTRDGSCHVTFEWMCGGEPHERKDHASWREATRDETVHLGECNDEGRCTLVGPSYPFLKSKEYRRLRIRFVIVRSKAKPRPVAPPGVRGGIDPARYPAPRRARFSAEMAPRGAGGEIRLSFQTFRTMIKHKQVDGSGHRRHA